MANTITDNTPVIIGVGQFSERPHDHGYAALSHMDLAGNALQAAIDDCDAGGEVAAAIDALIAIRQFEISYEGAVVPFGKSNNPPRSIAQRVGANPEIAILEITGGQANQKMVGEIAERIAQCEYDVAAIVGSEAVSTVLTLLKQGEKPDWSEDVEGSMDDRGFGPERIFHSVWRKHGTKGVIGGYACTDNARRAELGLSLDEYRHQVGELFAPFSEIAAANPHAAAPAKRTALELATITERNRIVAEPYTRMTVARDQVNQGAAIIVSSVGKAKQLGVPQDRWVYLHACTTADELKIERRPDLARSPASIASLERALQHSGKRMSDMAYLDFYSCFASPVFNAIDHFGIAVDDPRGLTLTGGLPFFGGAGNNYSAHAIAEAVQKVRKDRGSYALVGANGGVMSKYATGIYSTDPASWNDQIRYDRMSVPQTPEPFTLEPQGMGTVETYTWADDGKRVSGTVVIRDADRQRAVIRPDVDDPATCDLLSGGEPFGAKLTVTRDKKGRFLGRVA